MTDYTDAEIDRMVDGILDAGKEKMTRKVVCPRCGKAFETTRPSAKLCRSCLSESRRANGLKGGLAKHRAEPAPAPEPVPVPERVPVLLEERTFADSVELRSLWRVGGETEAVVIIRE